MAASQKSWEISQIGESLVFKLSSDGTKETSISSNAFLDINKEYTIKCEYDGTIMSMYINNSLVSKKVYEEGIYSSDVDLTVGSELHNFSPTAFAKIQLTNLKVLNAIPKLTNPVFPIYDALSSMGFNYTTVLSSDETMNSYGTVILPYDDSITQHLLNNIINSSDQSTTNVIIFNTNGYGPLLDIFGNDTTDSFVAQQLSIGNSTTSTISINAQKIMLKAATQVVGTYNNGDSSTPLVMYIKQNGLTIVYVNIYPVISQNQQANQVLLKMLTKMLENFIAAYDNASVSPWFTDPSLLFTGFHATGTISITPLSVVSVIDGNQSINVSSLDISTINSSEITLQSGYGFYANITALNPLISLKDNKSSIVEIKGNVNFLIRQPTINVDGKIEFNNFYMLHPPTVYTDGRDTSLTGRLTLNIFVSDSYTIAMPYNVQSSITVEYSSPRIEFDETRSFIATLPFCLLLVLFIIPIVIIIRPKSIYQSE